MLEQRVYLISAEDKDVTGVWAVFVDRDLPEAEINWKIRTAMYDFKDFKNDRREFYEQIDAVTHIEITEALKGIDTFKVFANSNPIIGGLLPSQYAKIVIENLKFIGRYESYDYSSLLGLMEEVEVILNENEDNWYIETGDYKCIVYN